MGHTNIIEVELMKSQAYPGRAARIVSEMIEVVDSDFILQTYRVFPRYCAGLPMEYIDSTMTFVPVLRVHPG